MSSSQRYSGRKRKQEYIPKERYDIDGTLIRNEEYSNKKSTWDFREIVKQTKKNTLSIYADDLFI